MRYIRLAHTDIELFNTELGMTECEFYTRHKEVLRRMWIEQGKDFWIRFILSFRSFHVHFGNIKMYRATCKYFDDYIDCLFINLHEEFVDGTFSGVKQAIIDILCMGQDPDFILNLSSTSRAKDPFYKKSTRDIYRRYFGPPTERASYIKVYILYPLYQKFIGGLIICLRRWIDSYEILPNDTTYWIPPAETKPTQSTADDIDTLYNKEIKKGSANGPCFITGWPADTDPRFVNKLNPLYDEAAVRDSDWRDNLSASKFRSFVEFLSPPTQAQAESKMMFNFAGIQMSEEKYAEEFASILKSVVKKELVDKPQQALKSPTKQDRDKRSKYNSFVSTPDSVPISAENNDIVSNVVRELLSESKSPPRQTTHEDGASKVVLARSGKLGLMDDKKHCTEIGVDEMNKLQLTSDSKLQLKTSSNDNSKVNVEAKVEDFTDNKLSDDNKMNVDCDVAQPKEIIECHDGVEDPSVTTQKTEPNKVETYEVFDKPVVNNEMNVKKKSKKKSVSKVLDHETVIGEPDNKENTLDSNTALRACAACDKLEPVPKSFKKCKRCKDEGWKNAKYYCGRQCQVRDWELRHRKEHHTRPANVVSAE